MCHSRYLVSDAHVRAAVVVEVDVAPDDATGMLEGVEAHAVDAFHLYFPVDALGNGYGQTAGQRERPSGRTRRPAPLLLDPRFFSDCNVEILLVLVNHPILEPDS